MRVEAISPSGAHPFEIRKLDAINGKAVCTLPIAFNEEPGPWKVQATDIASGLSRSAQFEVTR